MSSLQIIPVMLALTGQPLADKSSQNEKRDFQLLLLKTSVLLPAKKEKRAHELWK